jgi:hypothetical protein
VTPTEAGRKRDQRAKALLCLIPDISDGGRELCGVNPPNSMGHGLLTKE